MNTNYLVGISKDPKGAFYEILWSCLYPKGYKLSLASIKPSNYRLYKLLRAIFSSPNTFNYLFLKGVRLLL